WHPADGKPLPSSKPAGEYLNVTFINRRPEAVELIWLGADGSRKTYGTLAPDATISIRTRPGAVWVVHDAKAQPLGHFVVEQNPGKTAKAVIPASAGGANVPDGFGRHETRAIAGWTVHISQALLADNAA